MDKRSQDPSRRLGYQTYYNNFITQIFLKARVIFILFLSSLALSIIIPFLLNKTLFRAVGILINIISFFKFGIFWGTGRAYLLKTLSVLFALVLHSLFYSILIFVVLFPMSFIILKFRADKAYKKKYIRGIEILKMKDLIKLLDKEE